MLSKLAAIFVPRQLRHQLAWLTSLVLLLTIFVYAGYSANEQSVSAQNRTELRVVALAHNIAASSIPAIINKDLAEVENLLVRISGLPNIQEVRITDAGGRLLSHVVRKPGGKPEVRFGSRTIDTPAAANAATRIDYSKPASDWRYQLGLGDPGWVVVWLPIFSGTLLGWVMVDYDLDTIAQIRRDIWLDSLYAGAIALIASILLLLLFLKRPMGALQTATNFAARLDESDGAQLPVFHGTSEIESLTTGLNRTSTRLLTQNRDLNNQKFAMDQHDIVSITDLDGNITYANDKFSEISGFTRNELLGKNHRIIGSGAHDPQFFANLWNSISRGQVWRGEICNRNKGGSLYWVVATIVPLLNAEGVPEQYIAIRTDVSKGKVIELEKAQLLEKFKIQAQDLEVKSIALEKASQREVEIGNRIQQTLLVAPPAPSYPGLLVSAFSQASKGIDGDFFDVFRIGQNAIDVVVGDVMGKGVPAALLGAATKLQFSRSMAELLLERRSGVDLPQPKDIVSLVNHTMAPHLQALDAFVTLTYLRIDVKANTLTWIGCGHEESLLISAGGLVNALGNQHPPIGLFLDEAYSQDVCDLLPGDAVFLCSDGASDAILNNGERLGHELLRDTVRRHTSSHQTPAMVIHALRRDLLLDQVTLADDLTMVMLLRHDLQRNLARLEVPASLESLCSVREFIAAQSARLSEKVAGSLTVAAVEVITNVIRHATELVPNAPIELLVENSASGLQLDFKYLGAKFEPPVDPPAIDFSAYPEGGFGLGIISGATDRVEYLRHEGVNTVRLWIDYPA